MDFFEQILWPEGQCGLIYVDAAYPAAAGLINKHSHPDATSRMDAVFKPQIRGTLPFCCTRSAGNGYCKWVLLVFYTER